MVLYKSIRTLLVDFPRGTVLWPSWSFVPSREKLAILAVVL